MTPAKIASNLRYRRSAKGKAAEVRAGARWRAKKSRPCARPGCSGTVMAAMALRGAKLCTRCRAEVRGGRRRRAGDREGAAWISKHAAITLAWQHQAAREQTVGSRGSAISTLGEWRAAGRVRTKSGKHTRIRDGTGRATTGRRS
jgi:hypothetical protein